MSREPRGGYSGAVAALVSSYPGTVTLPHATTRLEDWIAARRAAGIFVLALDFDGTLSPIVPRPEDAALLPAAREPLRRLCARDDTRVAIVSGRGLADVRHRVALDDAYYAGNHGMEIDGPGVHRVHAAAAARRPALETCAAALAERLRPFDGVQIEDKGLTLSVHYRRAAAPNAEAAVLAAVEESCDRAAGLRATRGKRVVEVRPDVPWDKGRATRFLFDSLRGAGAPPVPGIFVGDDRTDEDAFRALLGGDASAPAPLRDAVVVADAPPARTAATCWVRSPEEVAALLQRLAGAP